MKFLRTVSLALTALAVVLAQPGRSFAEYPERPIRLLVPFPAGGAVDIVTRVMAAKMSEDLGKTFVIEMNPSAERSVATITDL